MISAQVAASNGDLETSFEDAAKKVRAVYFSNDFSRDWRKRFGSSCSGPWGSSWDWQ